MWDVSRARGGYSDDLREKAVVNTFWLAMNST